MNMIKLASPFVPGVTSTAMGHTSSSSTSRRLVRPLHQNNTSHILPKRPAQLNININNLLQADRFPHALFTRAPRYIRLTTNTDNMRPQLLVNSLPSPRYDKISQYISLYPPTPAGVPYRLINPVYGARSSSADNIRTYTNLLNRSGLFPEKLSIIDANSAEVLSDDISPELPIYLVDGRDAANWLWNRRGLLFTDELWDNAAKARLNVTSQLNKLPLTTYFAWSNSNNRRRNNAYSMRFNGNKDINNLFVHVFNPNYFDLAYIPNNYNGHSSSLYAWLELDPWQQFMNFLDMQDHELSHSFNDIVPHTLDSWDWQWVLDGLNSGLKDHMFFRRTNNPELPYYDDATTALRVQNFSNLFKGTYLEMPGEYIGAMSRVKRYGAELGFDTTNSDPVKARNAMALTLHYLANYSNPDELTPELQRIHSWLNTSAQNHMNQQNQRLPILDYIKDVLSPFYMNVLDFMTDATIQGLVRNDSTSNNYNALQNLRYGYA